VSVSALRHLRKPVSRKFDDFADLYVNMELITSSSLQVSSSEIICWSTDEEGVERASVCIGLRIRFVG
jgi:hypothetical protein